VADDHCVRLYRGVRLPVNEARRDSEGIHCSQPARRSGTAQLQWHHAQKVEAKTGHSGESKNRGN
jgi:hypothetical protein